MILYMSKYCLHFINLIFSVISFKYIQRHTIKMIILTDFLRKIQQLYGRVNIIYSF